MNYIQKKMNKKIISMFICLLLIGMIPMVAGMNNYADEPELEVNDEQTSPVIELELAGQPPHIGIAINIHNIFDGIFLGLGIKKYQDQYLLYLQEIMRLFILVGYSDLVIQQ